MLANLLKTAKELPIEKFFLFISLFFGLLYVFILPPFQSVDEASHFYRGYEIASFKLIPQKIKDKTGDYLPLSLETLASDYSFLIKNIDKKVDYKYIINSSKIKLNPEKTSFIDFKNTALYSPVPYLTQVPGMIIAKALNANPLTIFYLGRISNLIFFSLIIYFAIKIIPFYKLPLMLLALMPMTLSLAGSLTTDVVVIGFNFLWVALLLKFIYKKTEIGVKQILSLKLLAIALALSKHYFMLIPLVFLLPKTNFKNIKTYLICIFSVLLASTISVLLWQAAINHLYTELNSNAGSQQQLQFILTQPLSYLMIFIKSLIVKTPRIIITMIGVLGWQDTPLDFMTYIVYPVLVVLAIIAENRADFDFKKWQVYLISSDIVLSVCLIFTTMYLMWSSVGNSIITGLNGKYFTPIMLPFLLLFYNRAKIALTDNSKLNIKLFIYIAIILILISSDLSLLHRFYNLTPNLYYKV